MPTIFSHAIFASAIGSAFPSKPPGPRFWILTSVCAILPDFDVVAFALGISYDSVLGHRGITHSILFAILVGSLVSVGFFPRTTKRWQPALYFAAVTLSHPFVDMLTDGGLGVALFAPLSNQRYFFPWRPVAVSPIGVGFFGERGLVVVASEMFWIWLPSLLLVATSWLVRRKQLMRQ